MIYRVNVLDVDVDAATGSIRTGIAEINACRNAHVLQTQAVGLGARYDLGYRTTTRNAYRDDDYLWVNVDLYSSRAGGHDWQTAWEPRGFTERWVRAWRLTHAAYNPHLWALVHNWTIVVWEGNTFVLDELCEASDRPLIFAQCSTYRIIAVFGNPIYVDAGETVPVCHLCSAERLMERRYTPVCRQGNLSISLVARPEEFPVGRAFRHRYHIFDHVVEDVYTWGPLYRDGRAISFVCSDGTQSALEFTHPEHENMVIPVRLGRIFRLEHPIPRNGYVD
ncbi:MAG: hypothetical protein D6698_06515 [Gammaproteobacteria bacterium]|nr:MAG: hypothetical protein D6698_06515 [Gammaproteobacteria bacterium]